jgi:hypothetical protein
MVSADSILEKHRVFQDEKGRRAKQAMIEFAQYHVQQALTIAAECAIAKEDHSSYGTGGIWVDEKSILNSYPIKNIQ